MLLEDPRYLCFVESRGETKNPISRSFIELIQHHWKITLLEQRVKTATLELF